MGEFEADMLQVHRAKVDQKLFDLICDASKSMQPRLRRLKELIVSEREQSDQLLAITQRRIEQAEIMESIHRETIDAYKQAAELEVKH